MIANFLFFLILFFILGVIFYYVKEIIFLVVLILVLLLISKVKIKFLLFFAFSFLIGFYYPIFYSLIFTQPANNFITIERELSPSEKFKRYLVSYKNEKFILYAPLYFNLHPKSKLLGEFEIVENKIFIKEIKAIKSSIYEPIFVLKDKINQLIRKNYSQNSSEIISGILYGEEIKNLELRNYLKNTGLLHITAMSGYNLTILSNITYFALSSLNLSLLTINFASIIFILLFIVFTGFQSSVIRAGIMTIALILSKFTGRIPLTRNILIFTIFLITLFSPGALIDDLGFQLSFLATIGILYLSGPFEKFFKSKIVAETFSAQVMVLPLIWYKFGEFNLFSFLNNILFVPFIPFLMILGFIALIVVFFYPLNQILNIPFEIFANLISIFANFPKIYIPIPLVLVLIMYFYLGYLIYKINKDETVDFNFAFN
jgi:ComEC/Rec2-related protein